VARTHLGARTSLVAAASLVLDYVLNVAVAVTAGGAALTSAFPGLYDDGAAFHGAHGSPPAVVTHHTPTVRHAADTKGFARRGDHP